MVNNDGSANYDGARREGLLMDASDDRFTVPLFSPGEVGRFLRLGRRAKDWSEAGLVTTVGQDQHGLSIPYVGLLEAQVIQQLRAAGLSLAAIRDANAALKADLGVPHPLAWDRLAHDGRDVLRPFEGSWMRSKDRQRGIPQVIEEGLRRVLAWRQGYPSRVQLERYGGLQVISDAEVSGGHPILADGGIRVEDVVNLVKAGDSLDVAAEEFGLDRGVVERLVLADFRAA